MHTHKHMCVHTCAQCVSSHMPAPAVMHSPHTVCTHQGLVRHQAGGEFNSMHRGRIHYTSARPRFLLPPQGLGCRAQGVHPHASSPRGSL